MNHDFFNERRMITVNILFSLFSKLTHITDRRFIRFLARPRGFLNLGNGITNLRTLPSNTTRKLISRGPKIKRDRSLTKTAHHRRRNPREHDRARAGHCRVELSMLRNIMSNRPHHCQTAKKISVRMSKLTIIIKIRMRRNHRGKINRNVNSFLP